MNLTINPNEDIIADKIVTYFGYFEEYSLKSIAKKCTRMIISEYYKELCYGAFEMLTFEEMRSWVLEELKNNFEEKVMPLIESTYPDLTDEELDEAMVLLEKKYEKEHEQQLRSTTTAALKELKIKVKALQKDLQTLKRKYTI